MALMEATPKRSAIGSLTTGSKVAASVPIAKNPGAANQGRWSVVQGLQALWVVKPKAIMAQSSGESMAYFLSNIIEKSAFFPLRKR
jgi:hypothetical protein